MQERDSAPDKDNGAAMVEVIKSFQGVVDRFAGVVDRQLQHSQRERKWQNIRTGLMAFALISGPLFLLSYGAVAGRGPSFKDGYAAMVRVRGLIDDKSSANAIGVVNSLEQAFEDKKAKGVVVLINSPGGSPVQSSIIRDRLVALRAQYPEKKVWAVGEDMLTSGAYFIAVGSQNVCVNRSSVVGSIGVIQDGWGLDKVIQKFDIERRVFTAGASKARLDMFKPLTEEDQAKVKTLLGSVHEHFKDVVRAGRGDRLKGSEEVLFSGDFWTGEEAVRLGLVDRLCDLPTILDEEFGVQDAKDYTPPPSLLGGLARTMGAEFMDRLFSTAGPELLPQ